MNKKQLNIMIASFFTTVAIVAAVVLLVWLVVIPQFRRLPFFPSVDMADFHQYFSLNPDSTTIILEGEILRDVPQPIFEYNPTGQEVFLAASFARDVFDPFLFWEIGPQVLHISTHSNILEFAPGRGHFYNNGIAQQLAYPLRMDGGEVFLPATLLEMLYHVEIIFHPEGNILHIMDISQGVTVAAVAADSYLFFRPESRSPASVELAQGDEVIVVDTTPSREHFIVVAPNGHIGYVEADALGQSYVADNAHIVPVIGQFINNRAPVVPNWSGGPINMVWEAAHNQDANLRRMETPFHPSINVVSPTWLDFNAENLNLTSHMNQQYLDWARGQGVHVWPMVFDVNNATARAILMNREARQRVVNQIVNYVDTYQLTGINIDIEHLLNAEEGAYKIQFLRELNVPLRQRGVVYSAAIKPPAPWTMFYRRDLIALTVDFVMLMSYDQHYQASAVAGPVAALPWVQESLENTLLEVPEHQLLLGLPLYNRVWRESVLGESPLRPLNWGMEQTRDFFEGHNVAWVWDSEVGSYYGEVALVEDGEAVLYRVWLEDARSITAKMQIYRAFDLAGVASWRRGFETPDIWDIIEQNINN